MRAVLDGKSVAKAGLAESFEEAIVEADTVADARIASASQIERAAQVEARARVSLARKPSSRSAGLSSKAAATHWLVAGRRHGPRAVLSPPLSVMHRDGSTRAMRVLTLTRTAGESAARASMLREQADSATQTLRSRLHESGVLQRTMNAR